MGPRIVSVNVGRPRTVEWHGRKVRTSIFKDPMEGSVMAADVNLSGDDQADRRVHGGPDKAVYAYAVDAYSWWAAKLVEPLGAGTFGEDLTTDGINLVRSRIGARWHVGEAVFEVAQPREPCFKLGIRMGDAAFVDRFEEARRPGAYLRIVRPGQIAAGNAIAVVPADPPAIALVEMLEEPTSEFLQRILADGRVPRGWRNAAARALARAEKS